jgi:hypothetical protein
MAKAWPNGAHLCCQQIGAPTLDWLANATEATASEYVGYAEGVLAAQRFLRTRKPEAALSEEGVRAAVAVHFSPLAVQACTCPASVLSYGRRRHRRPRPPGRLTDGAAVLMWQERVDLALGAAPAELQHAELARQHTPTVWSLFRAAVRAALIDRCALSVRAGAAANGSENYWHQCAEWDILCQLQQEHAGSSQTVHLAGSHSAPLAHVRDVDPPSALP